MTDLKRVLDEAAKDLLGDGLESAQITCERFERSAPQPRLIRSSDGNPYLTRHYLRGGPTTPNAFDHHGAPRPGIRWSRSPIGLYLHHFHASDEDGALHNHPWAEAASFMLAGGYTEERLVNGRVTRRDVLPGDRASLTRSDFHRVELLTGEAWTLFAVGKFIGEWSYWDKRTGTVQPWRTHKADKTPDRRTNLTW